MTAPLDLDLVEAHERGCAQWVSPGSDDPCECRGPALVAEVRRLRAALDEAFDLDQLPIPYVVNYLVDLWHDQDGYDPGDPVEVAGALLSAITSAATPAGGHDVLDLQRTEARS